MQDERQGDCIDFYNIVSQEIEEGFDSPSNRQLRISGNAAGTISRKASLTSVGDAVDGS